jgi:hypothetical protein
MISFCSQCSGWLLTLVYQPKFCSLCGASIGRRVPLLEYVIVLAVAAAVVWVIVN